MKLEHCSRESCVQIIESLTKSLNVALDENEQLRTSLKEYRKQVLLEAADSDWCDARHSGELRWMAEEER